MRSTSALISFQLRIEISTRCQGFSPQGEKAVTCDGLAKMSPSE